jgi:photosystem II stability/assembly factor-like uncharacterized protein
MSEKEFVMFAKKKKFSLEWVLGLIMLGIIAIVIIGMMNRSGGSSADEFTMDSGSHPHVFSYAPNGETLWLGTHTGLYERKDEKWKRTLESLNNDIMGLEIDPSNPERIIISGHGFVMRTVDGGETWNKVEAGLPDQPDAHQLTMDNQNPDHLYVMLSSQGDNLYESKDGGESWVQVGSIPPTTYSIAIAPDNNGILGGSEIGLFRYSFNNGEKTEEKISNEPAFQLLTLPSGEVITMGEGGFLRSSDLKTWSPMEVDLNREMALGIKASKKEPNRFVIVTDQLRVFESKDSGNSWTRKENNMEKRRLAKSEKSDPRTRT